MATRKTRATQTPGAPSTDSEEKLDSTPDSAIQSDIVLTEGDAQADVAGEPRPDNQLTDEQIREIYPDTTKAGKADKTESLPRYEDEAKKQYRDQDVLTDKGWLVRNPKPPKAS